MQKHLFIVSALVSIGCLAGGSDAVAFTLEEELTRLVVDHPQIHQGQKQVESAGEAINTARAGFYPTVSMTADSGLERIDDPTQRAARHSGRTFKRNASTFNLTISQNLYQGGATVNQVEIARINREIAALTLQGTRQNTLFEGVRTYVDVLRQMRLVELSRANEGTIQNQLNLEDERVQRGSGIAVDVLQAKSRLQISKERRVNFEGTLADAVSRYIQVYNRAPQLKAMIDPLPPIELLPSELETAIAISLEENPSIINAAATIATAEGRTKVARSEYAPSVDLTGQSNYSKHTGGTLGTSRDQSVKLSTTWNLFSGFSTKAGIDQAAFDRGAAKDNLTFTARKVEEQVRFSWQALITVCKRIELLENAVNIAAEVFTARKKLREAGKETVLNVLDAESEVFNAQINFTAAFYDERVAVYQLLLSMGRLNSTYLRLASR
jgi:adhesin transport system outer membrane protein